MKSKKINKKELEKLLKESSWEKDTELSGVLELDVIKNSKGEAIVFFSERNRVLFFDRNRTLEELTGIAAEKPKHILQDILPEKLGSETELINTIKDMPSLFEIEKGKLDYSIESLDILEKQVKKIGYSNCISSPYYISLIAYTGEIIRRKISGSWKLIHLGEDNLIEPWIFGKDGRKIPVFSILYRELQQGNNGSLKGAIVGSIKGFV